MAKTCKYCGNQLPDESNICLDCFELCNEYQEANVSRRTNYKKTKSIIAIISSLLMIIVCCTSPAILYNNKSLAGNNSEIHNENNQDNDNQYDGSKLKVYVDKVHDFFIKDDNLSDNNTNPSDNVSVNNNDNINEKNDINTENINNQRKNSSSSSSSNISHITQNKVTSNKKSNNNTALNSTNPTTKKSNNNTTLTPNEPTTKPSSTEEIDDTGTDKFDYYIENEKIIIKKYTGDAINVVIPDKIDGHNVYKIECGAFINNSKIKSITFKDSEEYHILWISGKAFQNLSSLEKIIFPKNTDLGILNDVCNNCPKLSQIYIDHWQYKMVDGGLYYYNTKEWTIQYLCEGINQTTFNVPTWCSNIYQSDLLTYNNYITTVNVNSYVSSVNFIGGSKRIKEVNVDSENPYLKSINGIVYSKGSQSRLVYYPFAKTDKEFIIPNNTYISLSYDTNNYIETLKIPASVTIASSTIRSICLNYTFRNLKTIYIEKTSPYAQQIKSTFTGNTILY